MNQIEAGIWVFKKSFVGRFIIQSIKFASISAFLISPSPDESLVNAPFARTNPAVPVGAKW